LVLNLVRGFHWQELIDEGAYPNIKELAKAIGIDSRVVAKAIRLTWLSPKIIHKIIIGEVDISMQLCGEVSPLYGVSRKRNCSNNSFNLSVRRHY
jgi:hypothetical protein